MLNTYQRAIVKAYADARFHGVSQAVLQDLDETDCIVLPCTALWEDRGHQDAIGRTVVMWLHPRETPCWDDIDITPDELCDELRLHPYGYMNR